jgi:hypothetical protein
VLDGDMTTVRWQPVDGIWAQLETRADEPVALGIAARLRLDRVHRCAVPFRLTVQGPKRLAKCTTYFALDPATGRWIPSGGIWFSASGNAEYQLIVRRETEPPGTTVESINGYPVTVIQPTGNAAMEIRYWPQGQAVCFYAWPFGPIDPAFVRSLPTGYTVIDTGDIELWPQSPFA